VRDLKAFQIALPLYRQASELLGAEHAAVSALREGLVLLARGCHRYGHDDKADAYRNARDAASLAVCELLLTGSEESEPLIQGIEQDLMAAFSGLHVHRHLVDTVEVGDLIGRAELAALGAGAIVAVDVDDQRVVELAHVVDGLDTRPIS
jgi:hypothetical protein